MENVSGNESQRSRKKVKKSANPKPDPAPIRTTEEKEKLISAVSNFPNIWNKAEESYHNRDISTQSWKTVSDGINIPGKCW
jgi:Alcohol dehydrogenase transcription factor Myb/SANT-like